MPHIRSRIAPHLLFLPGWKPTCLLNAATEGNRQRNRGMEAWVPKGTKFKLLNYDFTLREAE